MADTPPGYLSNAQLAAGVQEQTDTVKQFKDEQTTLYTSTSSTTTVSDAEGNLIVVPTFKALAASGLASQGVFANTAAGMAATADGHYFQVASSDSVYLTLYRRDGGTATQINTYPSATGVNDIIAVTQGDVDTAVQQASAAQATAARIEMGQASGYVSYGTTAAMNADTTQKAGTIALAADSGLSYRFAGGVWAQVTDRVATLDALPVDEATLAQPTALVSSAGGLWMWGYDSLTEGAGGSNWRQYLQPILRGSLGYGGPGFVSFFNYAASEGWGFNKGGSVLYCDIADGVYGKYTIGGRGLYTQGADGGATCFFGWSTQNSRWKTCRIYYLVGPGLGSFRWRHQSQTGGTVVNCQASAFSLAYIDTTNPVTTSASGIYFDQITGNTAIFAADFVYDATKFRPGNIGVGGRKLADIAAMDSTVRQQWFAALAPRRMLLNGGMNDRITSTAAQHYSDLLKVVSDIQAGSPATAIRIIQSLNPSDAAITNFLQFTEQKKAVARARGCSYVDLRRRFGDYNTANAAGLMFDGIHPNDTGDRLIAAFYAQAEGLPISTQDPGAAAWDGSGTTPVYNRVVALSTASFANLAAGAVQQVYMIGLVNGSPVAVLFLRITANRNGTSAVRVKEVIIQISNTNVLNAATSVGAVTTTQTYSTNAGDGGTIDFSITAGVVNGKAQIVLTTVGYVGHFVITGRVEFPLLPTAGQSVFEN